MNKILEKARQIARQEGFGKREEAQDLLLKYLEDNPKDTEAWLLVLRIECSPPLYDPYRVIDYVNRILSYDPHNAKAILFLAYGKFYLMAGIDEDTYKKLCFAQSNDPEIMAMIEIAKSRYFESKEDFNSYEETLKRSIEYSDTLASSFISLAFFYLRQGKDGKNLLRKGLGNVKSLFPSNTGEEDEYDSTSVTDFFAEFYAQTTMNRDVYKEYKSLID